MDDQGNNSEGVPPEAMMSDPAEMIGAMVAGFCPHLDANSLRSVAHGVLAQQNQLGQVLHDAVEPKTRDEYPIWGYKLTVKDKPGVEAGVKVAKSPANLSDLSQVMHHATMVALVTSPAARAILYANGYELEFFQTKDSPIIRPS